MTSMIVKGLWSADLTKYSSIFYDDFHQQFMHQHAFDLSNIVRIVKTVHTVNQNRVEEPVNGCLKTPTKDLSSVWPPITFSQRSNL